MRFTLFRIIQGPFPSRAHMDDTIPILAGSGGVGLGEARTNHQGRKAIMLVREGDPSELVALAETMGIDIIEIETQSGTPDPKGFFGRGRLQDVGDELSGIVSGHPWEGVDLVIVHCNATPRQLVNIHNVVGVETWDRVRLLLTLFTSHASSVEARTQVRIAQLQADRTILRELANQQTTGERAGFGGGGRQAIQNVLGTTNHELAQLRKRQSKHALARRERRRQRAKGGAKTVGLAGYTNAGKSSLFLALSGKEVLVEDKLFSTLETTIGRMEMSPRILLADTIGFIDELPSELLDAFHATLDESLECDLLLLLVDSSDLPEELERKLETSRREVLGRSKDDDRQIQLVFTKSDKQGNMDEAIAIAADRGFLNPILVSSIDGEGMEILRENILYSLYGPQFTVEVSQGEPNERAVESYFSEIHNLGIVTEFNKNSLTLWCDEGELSRLISKSNGRVSIK